MHHSLFITGTDTDVGKTYASAYICSLLAEQQKQICYYKPIQCGPASFNGDEYSRGDAGVVTKLFEPRSLDIFNTFYLDTPASPHLAFKKAGREYSHESVIAKYIELHEKYDVVVCEGAGGVNVPITSSPAPFVMSDLIESFKAQCIVVARPELGTINHTLLTLESLKRKRIPILGFVFSIPSESFTETEIHTNNAETISQIAQIPFLGYIPFIGAHLPTVDTSHPLYKALKSIGK